MKALEEFREQGRKEFSESQKEVHKLNAKISQQAADVARYRRRIEKLRELLSKAGRLLEWALTSSRCRFGSLVFFRSRKFAGESDPR
jgi:chromosome segregation ATPase